MPLRTLPPAALRLLIQIRACNRRCIAESGDTDVKKIVPIINAALRDNPREVTAGLAHFLSAALDGEVLDFDAEESSDQAVGH